MSKINKPESKQKLENKNYAGFISVLVVIILAIFLIKTDPHNNWTYLALFTMWLIIIFGVFSWIRSSIIDIGIAIKKG